MTNTNTTSRRVIICGGRDFRDAKFMYAALITVLKEGDTIIEGGAKGADRIARLLAWIVFGLRVETFRAEWAKYGRAAGPIRNAEMLDSGVDLVIAFPGGKGTANMVRIASQRGISVINFKGMPEKVII